MSELRQNVATREWVIIAPERSDRPEDFVRAEPIPNAVPEHLETCPFCPGNEGLTTEELDAVRDADGLWQTRAVANKYPALSREGDLTHEEAGTRRWMSGVGLHEVIVETPLHNRSPAQLSVRQLERVLELYRRRYLAAIADPRIEMVALFKNHGPSAGTSLEHPHSQLIATPVVPAQVRQRIHLAMSYYEDRGRCVYCAMLDEELTGRERLVCETEHFAAFVLYAALSPFHTWILPKRHHSVFTELTDLELTDLAAILRRVLRQIHVALDDPDYNIVVRCLPGPPRTSPFFHHYLSIVPRVSTPAGFEMGSGMFINTVLPERAAEFLRRADKK